MGVLSISVEERDEIVQMRRAGVSVKEISKLTERSTHCVYRILKKVSDTQHTITTTNKKTTTPNTQGQSEPLSDSSAVLLCEVESMEVSALEPIPIPMPMSMSESQQQQMQAHLGRSDAVGTSVGFTTAPVATSVAKPRDNETSVGFWLLRDATASMVSPSSPSTSQAAPCADADIARHNQVQSLHIQPTKKQKTSTSQASEDAQVLPVLGDMESTPTIRAVPSAGAIIQTPAQSQLLLQSQLSKKQKTSTPQGCLPLSTPISSELAINQRSNTTGSTTTRNYSSDDRFDKLLERIQDEIRRLGSLAQSDIYDAQLLQMLVKFRAEMLLVRMQKAHCKVVEVSCKRVTEEGSGDMETNSLLRQRLVKEIALLEVQAARVRLELERERIKHKTTSILCRKRLLGAHASPADVDKLLPHH
ncbi:hypothetical protein KRP22_004315 [Phytophthora ramorum]|nr:hypothetical protein KRP22_13418 [Phytophthora ramorum]